MIAPARDERIFAVPRITLPDIRAGRLPNDDARRLTMLQRTCVHADNRFVKSSGKGNVKVSTVPHLPSSNAIFYDANQISEGQRQLRRTVDLIL